MHRDVLIGIDDLIGSTTPPPESMTIPRLIDRDSVDPGAQARQAAEAVDRAENAQKDFLGQDERFVPVAENRGHGELYHHALMLGDDFGAGRFVAACATAPVSIHAHRRLDQVATRAGFTEVHKYPL